MADLRESDESKSSITTGILCWFFVKRFDLIQPIVDSAEVNSFSLISRGTFLTIHEWDFLGRSLKRQTLVFVPKYSFFQSFIIRF